MENIEFVEANRNDLNIILEIYNHYIETTTTTFDSKGITLQELEKRIFINHTLYKTYMIFRNKKFLGFCFLTQYREKQAYDNTAEIGIYLKPDFTGKGLGRKIVKHLEDIAITNGIKVLIASISGENDVSLRLFNKMKYEKCAHYKEIAIKFGRKQDIIDFQKIL